MKKKKRSSWYFDNFCYFFMPFCGYYFFFKTQKTIHSITSSEMPTRNNQNILVASTILATSEALMNIAPFHTETKTDKLILHI